MEFDRAIETLRGYAGREVVGQIEENSAAFPVAWFRGELLPLEELEPSGEDEAYERGFRGPCQLELRVERPVFLAAEGDESGLKMRLASAYLTIHPSNPLNSRGRVIPCRRPHVPGRTANLRIGSRPARPTVP